MKETRTNKVTIKFSDTELQAIINAAGLCGMKPSTFIRNVLNEKCMKEREEEKEKKEELPSKVLSVNLLLTSAEYEKITSICLRAEKTPDEVVTDSIRNGKIIQLPFYDRENSIKELTRQIGKINENYSNISDVKEQMDILNKSLHMLLKQENISTKRLESAIRDVIYNEIKEDSQCQ